MADGVFSIKLATITVLVNSVEKIFNLWYFWYLRGHTFYRGGTECCKSLLWKRLSAKGRSTKKIISAVSLQFMQLIHAWYDVLVDRAKQILVKCSKKVWFNSSFLMSIARKWQYLTKRYLIS